MATDIDASKALTLIVPAYNMERYLDACCRSVVLSDDLMSRLEVIVVNDGSTDGTSEIAHSFERRYPGTFRVIDKENGHYGSCVNCGLAEAKGEFVKTLDADDSVNTAEFARLLEFLIDGSASGALDEVDLVLSDYCTVDATGAETSVLKHGEGLDVDVGVDEPLERCCFMHMSTFRAQTLRDIGYHQSEGILYTDLEWITYPMLGVRKIRYLPGVVYRSLQGREGQSISREVVSRSSSHLEKILARMVAELGGYHGDPGRSRFFAAKLHSVAANLYYNYFIFAPLAEVNDGFARVDAIVAKNASLAVSTGKVVFSRRLKYPYVSRWRKNGRLSLFAIFLARVYSRLANGVFCRKTRHSRPHGPVVAVEANLLYNPRMKKNSIATPRTTPLGEWRLVDNAVNIAIPHSRTHRNIAVPKSMRSRPNILISMKMGSPNMMRAMR